MLSWNGLRAIFEIAIMGLRLFLMGVSVFAFWALVPACLIWLFSEPMPDIRNTALGLWLVCALMVAVFNFRLMWHRFDYGEWRNVAAYALTSLAILAVSPFFLPVYGDL